MNAEHDSSSSDDDEKLREALDERMFSVVKSTSEKRSDCIGRGTHDHYRDKVLNVTPEFQNFVAKRLSDTLDRIIEECQPKKYYIERDHSAGIRLFTDSKALLVDCKFTLAENTCHAESKILVRTSKRKSEYKMKTTSVKREANELDEGQKFRDAAISAEWILSGESTKGWSRPKGEVLAYRKNEDGVFEAEESAFNFTSSRNRLQQNCTFQHKQLD